MAIQPISQLKVWFLKGLKPLEGQFHDWMDSYWHKDEKIPMSSIESLNESLNSKGDTSAFLQLRNEITQQFNILRNEINNTLSQVDNEPDVYMPIHALLSSVNITESLAVIDIAVNHNCEKLLFVDKADANNKLEINCRSLQESSGETIEEISLEQFLNKAVSIIATPMKGATDVDISLTLKKI